jgi:hypothetical protein
MQQLQVLMPHLLTSTLLPHMQLLLMQLKRIKVFGVCAASVLFMTNRDIIAICAQLHLMHARNDPVLSSCFAPKSQSAQNNKTQHVLKQNCMSMCSKESKQPAFT